MFGLIRSEMLKMRHTFSLKLVFLAPIITLILGYILSGSSVQFAAYNWWYTMLCPITISVTCASIINRENKTDFQNILCLTNGLRKIWVSKVIALTILLFISNLLLWTGCTVFGVFTVMNISPFNGVIGCILLSLTYLWQIPLTMILTKFLGYLPAVLISFGCNVVLGLIGTETSWFMVNLYAIPARIVCPFFGIRPNGLMIEDGSYLLDTNAIIPAVIISLIVAGGLLLLTSKWFSKGGKRYD